MKKIGIITITDYLNYGNRLQNYATQELLKSLGFEVESIVNYPVKVEDDSLGLKKRIVNALKQNPLTIFKKGFDKIQERLNSKKYHIGQKAKEQSFRKYNKKHIDETDYVVTTNEIPTDLGSLYDYFVVGSDQIWNPNIRYGSAVDFLTFAPAEKRIALSPSFGVSSIAPKFEERYTKWLNEMAFLSVRERAGAELIKKLTGREAPVLIDPTLMLSPEQWLKVAETARKKPKSKYLLTYFIGALSSKRKKALREIASKNNLEIVHLKNLDDFERYDANPGEFIDYIHSAELICTDSFHSVIFSMQMRKPFLIFDREGKSAPMSSRIDTLLSTFDFKDRKYSNNTIPEKVLEIDYSGFEERLIIEREKVYDYLNNALKK